jgi:hypothetical protein
VRGKPLVHLRRSKTLIFQPKQGIKDRSGHSEPVVESVFCPADGVRRHFRKPWGNLGRLGVKLGVIDGKCDKADAFPLGAAGRLAKQQIIFRLRHTAKQRPDDSRMIACSQT